MAVAHTHTHTSLGVGCQRWKRLLLNRWLISWSLRALYGSRRQLEVTAANWAFFFDFVVIPEYLSIFARQHESRPIRASREFHQIWTKHRRFQYTFVFVSLSADLCLHPSLLPTCKRKPWPNVCPQLNQQPLLIMFRHCIDAESSTSALEASQNQDISTPLLCGVNTAVSVSKSIFLQLG